METFLYFCKFVGRAYVIFFFIGPIFADIYSCLSIEKCDYRAVKLVFGTINIAWLLLLLGILLLCVNPVVNRCRNKIK